MPVTCKFRLLPLRYHITDELAVEGRDYFCSQTRPDIPYTIYVSENELLLVPRQVEKLHPLFAFPTSRDAEKRFTLKLSDLYLNKLREQYGREPKFSCRRGVTFGMEDDEVVVAAIVEGTNQMAVWEFKALFNGHEENTMDQSSDVEASLGILHFDLSTTARR